MVGVEVLSEGEAKLVVMVAEKEEEGEEEEDVWLSKSNLTLLHLLYQCHVYLLIMVGCMMSQPQPPLTLTPLHQQFTLIEDEGVGGVVVIIVLVKLLHVLEGAEEEEDEGAIIMYKHVIMHPLLLSAIIIMVMSLTHPSVQLHHQLLTPLSTLIVTVDMFKLDRDMISMHLIIIIHH